ncbi:MAG TPA: hypothetical protein VJL37_10800 [Flavobacterium sp.]|nr:hypothetical protein [Flavobacterium sp.]
MLFQIGNKEKISPSLNKVDGESLIELQINNETSIETTPFFRVPFTTYLLALSTTILMELLFAFTFAFAFFIKYKIDKAYLLYIPVCSLITHSILWLICSYFIG